MSMVETIPMSNTPEAEAFINREGRRTAFEAMLDHARDVVPDLRGFSIHLDDVPHTGPPGISIGLRRGPYGGEPDFIDDMIAEWMVATFPPEVLMNFSMLSTYDADTR